MEESKQKKLFSSIKNRDKKLEEIQPFDANKVEANVDEEVLLTDQED